MSIYFCLVILGIDIDFNNYQLELFDLRFCDTGIPVKTFQGHCNSFSTKLVRRILDNFCLIARYIHIHPIQGITVDPSEEYLFAAGQDRRIRGWAIGTGCPLFNDSDEVLQTTSLTSPSALNTIHFEEASTVLKVTEEPSGLRLWANDGRQVLNFTLRYPATLYDDS